MENPIVGEFFAIHETRRNGSSPLQGIGGGQERRDRYQIKQTNTTNQGRPTVFFFFFFFFLDQVYCAIDMLYLHITVALNQT
jgi:hypothetical protein